MIGVASAVLAIGLASVPVTVDDLLARVYTNAKGKTIPYRLFVPTNYDKNKQYPIVIFLHGAGERGNDNRKQLSVHPGPLVFVQPEAQAIQQCFFVAPQCPDGQQWVDVPWSKGSYSLSKTKISDNLQLVVDVVDGLESEFSIDESRVYVTGMSMGGYATWDLSMRYAGGVAAAIPICGGGDPREARRLKGAGVWAFHSADDPVVPVKSSRDMIRAMWSSGQTPNYTEYTSGGHDAWTRAYDTPGLAAWLFSFRIPPKR